MSFLSFLVFLMASIGLTNVMVDSYIAEPLRNLLKKIPFFEKMLDCYQCTGFWCGMICSAIILYHDNALSIGMVFLMSFIGSYAASMSSTFMNYLEARTIIHLDDEDN